MAIYPLSKLIFRTHELTNSQLRLCPECLRENSIENATCSYCGEDIPNYTEETFVFERIKRISDSEEIGIGSSSEKLKREKDKFIQQWELWDQIVLTAKFVSSYTVSRIDPLEYARAFLSQFPLAEKTIETLQLNKVNLQLEKRNSSSIKKKLIEIEHRDTFNYFSDFATWSWVFLDEVESSFIYKNLSWINIHYGYYKDFNGQDIRIDEKNPAHISKAIEQIQTFEPTKLNVEVLLFPLHWKFLAEERVKANSKPMISKPRYEAALERWIPKTKSHQAWKELGIHYCQNAHGDLPESICTYRDQQLKLDIEERDSNFLFSLAMITGTVTPETLQFAYQKDSYFSPLISLYQDSSYVKDYFLNSSNRETWIRALHFFDFTNVSFQSELAAQILTELTEEEFSNHIGLIHPSLLKYLLKPALENTSKKKLKLTLDLSQDWKSELENINLIELYKRDIDTLKLLLDKTSYNYQWSTPAILELLKELPSHEPLVEKCLQILRNDPNNKTNLLLEIFNLWVASKKQDNAKITARYMDFLPAFMESKNLFSVDFQPLDFKERVISLWTSTDSNLSNLAEEFIETHVDNRGTRLESVTTEYSDQEIFRLFREILKISKLRVPRSIAYTFVSALLQFDRLSTEELQALWTDLPMMDHEHRTQLEYRIKEKLPPVPSATDDSKQKEADAKAAAETAQKELVELKRKMAQMEQQQKIAEETNRVVQEAKDKSARYQIKLAQIQSQFQVELNKVMTSALAPDEKSKKISDITAQFNKDMLDLSELLK